MLTALAFALLLAQDPSPENECNQTWTVGSDRETLRNVVHVGGGYALSTDATAVYRCVNNDTVWVHGGDAQWWVWRPDGFWEGPYVQDPGGVPLGRPSVAIQEKFTLSADHDGFDTLGYRLYIDEKQYGPDLDLSIQENGIVVIPEMSMPTSGDYKMQLAAFNAEKELKSEILTLHVYQPVPDPPTALRVRP